MAWFSWLGERDAARWEPDRRVPGIAGHGVPDDVECAGARADGLDSRSLPWETFSFRWANQEWRNAWIDHLLPIDNETKPLVLRALCLC
jgi:hypothetical protein